MAWIEIHQTLPTHRKLLRAADILEYDPIDLMGHIICIWLWALDNAPDGLIDCSDRHIARIAYWHDDPTRFVNALIHANLLEQDDAGHSIHDWQETGGKLQRQREQKREATRARRASVGGTFQEHSNTVPECSDTVSEHSGTVLTIEQSRAEQSRAEKDKSKGSGSRAREEPAAEPQSMPALPAAADYVAILLSKGYSEEEISQAEGILQNRPKLPAISNRARYLETILADMRSDRAAISVPLNGAPSEPPSRAKEFFKLMMEGKL